VNDFLWARQAPLVSAQEAPRQHQDCKAAASVRLWAVEVCGHCRSVRREMVCRELARAAVLFRRRRGRSSARRV
jgi:hypothetical protein